MRKHLTSWRWWMTRMGEIVIALALFYITVSLMEYRDAVSKADVPASDWFVLEEIYVPDHEVGSNPSMVYDRDILVDHRGFWVAEAQRINPDGQNGVFRNACSGSGVDDYDKDEVLGKDDAVSWEWFFGRPCTIPPGTYRIQLTRDMTKPGYPVKQMRGWSNTFHVYAPGESLRN